MYRVSKAILLMTGYSSRSNYYNSNNNYLDIAKRVLSLKPKPEVDF